ncbi:hypothetical protein [Methanosphaera cuniculi]|uniref:Uncharacterized protein n=1 Tax=Methanosphaera cuniculi TaxID=1077256 RepID=A0A2A2HFS6_9EURY|nr:hypothetical protein [Methanosphaera cuniculi]PAV08302.1 hypothetical protein ASJ82_03710 [Methanosphaera cuniculi]PWL08397.1 hypothetical protein MSCUN_08360 [Methanosphaera cuniculi]
MFKPKKIHDTIKAAEIFISGVTVGYAIKEIVTSETFQNIKTEIINSINFNEEDMKTVDINTDNDNTTDNSTKTTKTSIKTQLKDDKPQISDEK